MKIMTDKEALHEVINCMAALKLIRPEHAKIAFNNDCYLEALVLGLRQAQKMRRFYVAVAKLTMEHDTIGDDAVVFPSRLGIELQKINPNWWEDRHEV